jgi:predicted transglutaminase-like cysteine proteinase
MSVHEMRDCNRLVILKKRCRRAAGFSHADLFTEHLRDDEDHHGAEEAAAAKKIY